VPAWPAAPPGIAPGTRATHRVPGDWKLANALPAVARSRYSTLGWASAVPPAAPRLQTDATSLPRAGKGAPKRPAQDVRGLCVEQAVGADNPRHIRGRCWCVLEWPTKAHSGPIPMPVLALPCARQVIMARPRGKHDSGSWSSSRNPSCLCAYASSGFVNVTRMDGRDQCRWRRHGNTGRDVLLADPGHPTPKRPPHVEPEELTWPRGAVAEGNLPLSKRTSSLAEQMPRV